MSVNLNDEKFVEFFDELPLWSAPFGEVILNTVRFEENANVLDIGCGTGFPFIELAQRFGDNSKVYGLDPWAAAINRIKTKIEYLGLKNAFPVLGKAEELPFENDFFDLVVSNNGLNNVESFETALKEIFRVSKVDAQLTFTFNLPDTMQMFYDALTQAMIAADVPDTYKKIEAHIASKRPNVNDTSEMVRKIGFEVIQIYPSFFNMRFANSKAMLNHSFIKSAFLPSWLELADEEIIKNAGKILDKSAEKDGEIRLIIPFACFDCVKANPQKKVKYVNIEGI